MASQHYTDNKALELMSLKLRQNFVTELLVFDYFLDDNDDEENESKKKKPKKTELDEINYDNFRYDENSNESIEFIKYTRLKDRFGEEITNIFNNYRKKPQFINYTYTVDEGYILFIHNIYRYFFRNYKFGSKDNYKLEDFKATYYTVTLCDGSTVELTTKDVTVDKKGRLLAVHFNNEDISIEKNKPIYKKGARIPKDVKIKKVKETKGDYIYALILDPYSINKKEIGIGYTYNQHINDVLVAGVVDYIEGDIFTIDGVEYDMSKLSYTQHNNYDPLYRIEFDINISIKNEDEKEKFLKKYASKRFVNLYTGKTQKKEIMKVLKKNISKDLYKNADKILKEKTIKQMKTFIKKNFKDVFDLVEDITHEKKDIFTEALTSIVDENNVIYCNVNGKSVVVRKSYLINGKLQKDEMLEFIEDDDSITNIDTSSVYHVKNEDLFIKKCGNPFSYITRMVHFSILYEINATNKAKERSLLFNGISDYEINLNDQKNYRDFENKYIHVKDKNDDVFNEKHNDIINKCLLDEKEKV